MILDAEAAAKLREYAKELEEKVAALEAGTNDTRSG